MYFRKRAYIIALAFVCSTTLFIPNNIYANNDVLSNLGNVIGASDSENDLSVKINAKVITSVNGAVKHLKIEMPSDELLFGFKLTINYDSSALELIGDVTSKLLSDTNTSSDGVIVSTGTNYGFTEECSYILEADFRVLNEDYEDFSINFDEFYEVVGVQEFEDREVSLNIVYETEKDYILGDVNLDGKINVMDAVAILQYGQGQIQHFGKASTNEYDLNHDGLEKTLEDDLWVADTNTDGTINVMDAVAILQYSSGTITELTRKETISSQIVDTDGSPISDVKVSVVNNDTSKLVKTATSDENGNFSLGLKEGDYTLIFTKDGYITSSKSVNIDGYDNTPPLDETIIMTAGTDSKTTLTGTVVNTDGVSISFATIEVQKDEEIIDSITTENDGDLQFEFTLDSGIYNLIISRNGYETTTISVILDGSSEIIALGNIVLETSYTGLCGENTTYSFDESTGTLTISGTGEINYCGELEPPPWSIYKENIKNVIIESGITSIGDCAFNNCTSLVSVTIPDSVTSISYSAFSNCISLENVTIPNSVITIGDGAFYCESLTDVYYTGTEEEWNAIEIGDNNDPLTNATIHFLGESNDSYTGSCGENATYSFDVVTSTLTISGTGEINGYEWSYTYTDENGDGDEVHFKTDIKSVVIEDGITSIGDSAFYNCTSLVNIVIPNSVTCIDYFAFGGCDSLESITIPDSVIEIDMFAFCDCTALENVKLSENLIFIGNCAFFDCTSLKEITIPSSVMTISSAGGEAIDSAIGKYEYAYNYISCIGCIEDFTIYGVKGSVAEQYAIQYDFNFVEIEGELPTSGIFAKDRFYFNSDDYDCWSFDKSTGILTVDVSCCYYNADIYSTGRYPWKGFKNNIKNIEFTGNVEDADIIALESFKDYTALESFTVPDSVTYIGKSAFSGCKSLESITIPNSVTEIDGYAFDDCTSLTDVYFNGTEEEWNAIEISEGNDYLTNATINFAKQETTIISGKVVDSDGNALSNVNIKIDLDTVTSTDENGEFSFDILNGEYTLSFEKDGYKSISQSITVDSDGNLSLDDIALEVIITINGIPEDEYYEKIKEVISLVNEYRVDNGLNPMYTSDTMNELAQQRAAEQETTGLSHYRPDGSVCFTIFDENNITYTAAAENVASGSSTAEAVMEQWKNSSGHNANILDDYGYIGVGVTYYNGTYYWVQLFCSTTDEQITSNAYGISNATPWT